MLVVAGLGLKFSTGITNTEISSPEAKLPSGFSQ